MKKIIIIALILSAFWYLIIAFVLIEIDFTQWCIEARGFLVCMSVCISTGCVLAYPNK